MEERFERQDEELISNAVAAGAGAVLVGVGVALAYLLGKGRPNHHIRWTADITIDQDGSISQDEVLEVYVDRDRPPTPKAVLWYVTNRGEERVLSFENFERRNDDKKITPLERAPGKRIRRIPARVRRFPVESTIDRDAVADLLADPNPDPDLRHEYKYDIWIDRVRQADPEIAIIRR